MIVVLLMSGATVEDIWQYYKTIPELDADYNMLYKTRNEEERSRIYSDDISYCTLSSMIDSDLDDDYSSDGTSSNESADAVGVNRENFAMRMMTIVNAMRQERLSRFSILWMLQESSNSEL